MCFGAYRRGSSCNNWAVAAVLAKIAAAAVYFIAPAFTAIAAGVLVAARHRLITGRAQKESDRKYRKVSKSHCGRRCGWPLRISGVEMLSVFVAIPRSCLLLATTRPQQQKQERRCETAAI